MPDITSAEGYVLMRLFQAEERVEELEEIVARLRKENAALMDRVYETVPHHEEPQTAESRE